MAKLSKREIDKIIERDLPGYKVAKRGATTGRDTTSLSKQADQHGQDIETLKRKYLGETDTTSGTRRRRSASDSGNSSPDEPEDEFVVVQPKDATDPWAAGARPKTVVVSGKDRKIVATQG